MGREKAASPFEVEILNTESLGTRGMTLKVVVDGETIVIDPGVALGYTRHKLHPHPLQAAAGERIKERILEALGEAGYIVISHLHGDHTPLYNANPFQLNLARALEHVNGCARVVVKRRSWMQSRELDRLKPIARVMGDRVLESGAGFVNDYIEILGPYPHGLTSNTLVITTVVHTNHGAVVHAPGEQLLCSKAVEEITSRKPRLVFIDGPPIYRVPKPLWGPMLVKAQENLKVIAENTDTIVIDHHTLRCDEGMEWVKTLARIASEEYSCRIQTASEYMRKPNLMLEAWRETCYRKLPIARRWFRFREGWERAVRDAGEILRAIEGEVGVGEPRGEEEFSTILEKVIERGVVWRGGET